MLLSVIICLGQIDSVESLASKTREEAVENAKQQAKDLAIKKGADPATVEVILVKFVKYTHKWKYYYYYY